MAFEGGMEEMNAFGGRKKLKKPIEVRKLAPNGAHIEFEFEDDPEEHEARLAEEMKENRSRKQKKAKNRLTCFENCSLKNITAKAVSDDATENQILLSSFEYLSSKFTNVTDDGGVKKKIERIGNGPPPPLNARVWIHYEAWLEDNDEPIDSTYTRKQPYSFKLFQNDVLAVLEYGVASMGMKEKSRFLATPDYAYGPMGIPNLVGPDALVLFVVELVDYMEAATISTVFKMSAEERALLNFDELQKAANELKVSANEYVQNEEWSMAIPKYRKAIHILERYLNVNEDVEKQRNDFLFTLYNNMAMCNLQMEDYAKTIVMCKKALELPPGTNGNKCKAYYRQAKAEFGLGHFDEAKTLSRTAVKIEPLNREVRTFYDKVLLRLEADEKEQKFLFKKMFSNMSLKDSKEVKEGAPAENENSGGGQECAG